MNIDSPATSAVGAFTPADNDGPLTSTPPEPKTHSSIIIDIDYKQEKRKLLPIFIKVMLT